MIKPPLPSDSTIFEAPRQNRGASFVYDSKQSDFYKHFGKKVKAARKQAGLTQEETARKAGLDRAYLSQIETGKRNPSFYLACRLALALNLSLDSFLDVAGDP